MWNIVRLDLTDALLAIRRRWFRSILSSLGIAIGVCALIVTLSISEGALEESTAQYHQLGLNTLRIQAPEYNASDLSVRSLRESELDLIQSLVPDQANVATSLSNSGLTFKALDQGAEGTALYVSNEWFAVEKLAISLGRPLTDTEYKFGERACVVGAELARELRLRSGVSVLSFGQQSCAVVGVIEPVEGGFVQNDDIRFTDINRSVVLPITAQPQINVYELYPLSEISVGLAVENPDEILHLADKLAHNLREEFGKLISYQLIVPLELLTREEESQKSFVLIMMTISFMVLLVGGVGIMNIMLTHISEQTREIGLRLAVGAEPKRILQIFLFHSLLITFAGCVLGCGVGLIFVLVFDLFSEWPISLSLFALIAGPAFSMMIGLLFGLYPALRASQMDPIIMLKEQ